MEKNNSLNYYFSQIENGLNEKSHQLCCDDVMKRQKMIEENLKLVIFIAKNFYSSSSNIDFLDIIQEGNIGLIEAAKRFDKSKGYKFSTYATWWIRQAIIRFINEQQSSIYYPSHIRKKIKYFKRTIKKLNNSFKREPTVSEIAKEMNISEEEVGEIKKMIISIVSLNQPILTEEGDTEIQDLIEDKNYCLFDDVYKAELKKSIKKILDKTLTPFEKKVISLKYGLSNKRRMSNKEIAEFLQEKETKVNKADRRACFKLRDQTDLCNYYNNTAE